VGEVEQLDLGYSFGLLDHTKGLQNWAGFDLTGHEANTHKPRWFSMECGGAAMHSSMKWITSLCCLVVFMWAGVPARAMTEDERNNIELYQRLAPGVVNITSIVLEHDFFLNTIPRQGVGSGSIIDPRGYILTNHHVIEDARKLEVTLANGKKYNARLVGSDPDTDIAVVKIDAQKGELTVIPMGSSASLKVGQKAIAIGNPFGLGQTLTTGVISSVGRTLRASNGVLVEDVIQSDASINPGNSGGPLIDSSGKMIGINTAIFSPTGASVGIGFAIPVDTAKRVINDLIDKGYYAYPWIGATLVTLFPDVAEALRLPIQSGAMVLDVVPGGPADKAGVMGGNARVQIGNNIVVIGGDVIVRIDGEPVTTADSVIRKIRRLSPGSHVRLEVFHRDKTYETLTVVLGERPKNVRTR
jgi:S1-C subfamily serine protease